MFGPHRRERIVFLGNFGDARLGRLKKRVRCNKIVHFCENVVFTVPEPFFLSAHACRLRISLKTRSAHACAIQTRFRPSHFKVFFHLLLLKCIGFVRPGPALLWLSHAWLFSARNTIRSRLCGPNTHSSRPFLHFVSRKCFVLLRPSPVFFPPIPA